MEMLTSGGYDQDTKGRKYGEWSIPVRNISEKRLFLFVGK